MLKRHKDLVVILIILFSLYSFFGFVLPGCTGQGKGDIAARGTETATQAQEPTPATTSTPTPTPTSNPQTPAVTKYAYVLAGYGKYISIYNAETYEFIKKMGENDGLNISVERMCFSNTKRAQDLPKYLYVTNKTEVKRFNLSTQAIDTTGIWASGAVPGLVDRDVDISPDDKRLYTVSGGGDNKLIITNVDTQNEVTTISPGAVGVSSLWNFAITPNGQSGVMADGGFGPPTYHIPFVNLDTSTDTYTIITPHTTTNVGGFGNVAVDPNGVYAYLTMGNVNKVAIVNINTRAILGYVNAGDLPYGIITFKNQNGSFAYVCNSEENTISVLLLDGANTTALADKIPVGTTALYPGVSSDNAYVWVPCADSDNIYVIRTADHSVVKTINTDAGAGPWCALVE